VCVTFNSKLVSSCNKPTFTGLGVHPM
jgi:hypothetical protein